ncbi:MAG: hypothetical protein K0S01_3696 [Herbinix sp.]|jgi:zinc transport system substrate-binding protein|nr:hypothetical protein [Herbinix sp.]
MKKKLMLLLGIMLVLTVAGAILIRIVAPNEEIEVIKEEDKLKVVTTFYPVYMIGLNIADQAENIEVKSLTDLNTGCLHDYQLTTEDMKIISAADIMIINGGGMEGFLEDIATNYPNLTIINASEGLTMLHNASNGIGSDEIEANTADDASKVTVDVTKEVSLTEPTVIEPTVIEPSVTGPSVTERSNEEATIDNANVDKLDFEGLNPHVWLDPKLYIKQIENVRDGILKYLEDTDKELPNISEEIEKNAQTYIQEVMRLDSDIDESIKSLSLTMEQLTEKQVVIFHDSFAYLANRVGMKVAFTVPLDSDTALSAGDIAYIIRTVRKDNIKYLFTEQQYSDSIAKQIEAETVAKVFIIDSAVTGDGSKDSYLKAMRKNLNVLKEALN